MNADGGSFPENMKVFGDMVTHNLTFDPLEGRANLMINSPLPDDWFMLAHTNKRDEEMDFVERVSKKESLYCVITAIYIVNIQERQKIVKKYTFKMK